MMSVESGTTYVRVDNSFGVAEARRLRDALALLAPIRQVSIDFSAAKYVDDAALSTFAQLLAANPDCEFRFHGLTQHKRRLLRYMGVHDREPDRYSVRSS